VQLDGGLGDPFLREEVGDLEPLITLKLNDLTHLLVVDESAVAGEFLKCSDAVSDLIERDGREETMKPPS
jgi:hypothetical protein